MPRRSSVHRLHGVLALSVLLGVVLPGRAHAQPEARPAWDAREAALRGFSTADLARIEPLLARGTVGLVELNAGELIPAVHLAVRVRAPVATIADVIATPEDYPRFMPAVSEVGVTEREGSTTAFSWRWQTAIFALRGQAMLTRFDPPPAQAARGVRVVVERTEGDLGYGREVWRVLPRGRDESLVLLSARMDLRDANYLTRSVAAASQSINRSVNLAMATALLLRSTAEAERRAGHPVSPRTATLVAPELSVPPLLPLLARGDLILMETSGASLVQSSVVTLLPHPEERVRRVMMDPVAFTQALIPGSSAVVSARRPLEPGGGEREELDFRWAVDLPIVGTGGEMTLREREDGGVELDATGGAMDGGRWRFRTEPAPGGATAVIGWAAFDVGDANFLLRAIVDADEAFRPGLSAATEVMMARALRIRVGRPLE